MKDRHMPEDDEGSQNEATVSASLATSTASALTANPWVVPAPRGDLDGLAEELKSGIADSDSTIEFLGDYQNTLVVFFAVAREVIYQQLGDLLENKIVADEYQTGAVANEIDKTDRRVKMLARFGIIESELEDDLENIIGERRSLVHDPKYRHQEQNLNLLEDHIDVTLNTIEKLDDLLEDE